MEKTLCSAIPLVGGSIGSAPTGFEPVHPARGGGALGPAASSLATCSWLPIETHQPLRPEVSAGLSVLHLCPDPGQPCMGVNSHPPSRSAAHPRPEGIAVDAVRFHWNQ